MLQIYLVLRAVIDLTFDFNIFTISNFLKAFLNLFCALIHFRYHRIFSGFCLFNRGFNDGLVVLWTFKANTTFGDIVSILLENTPVGMFDWSDFRLILW